MAVLDFFKRSLKMMGKSKCGVPQAPSNPPVPVNPTVVQETQTVVSAPSEVHIMVLEIHPRSVFNGIGAPNVYL